MARLDARALDKGCRSPRSSSAPSSLGCSDGSQAATLAEGRRRADNPGVSLLAYSVRRAFGALLVFLVVIWLIQFGIAHLITASSSWRPGDTAPPSLVESLLQYARLAHEWNIAALEVGVGVVMLLGLGAAWRQRERMA